MTRRSAGRTLNNMQRHPFWTEMFERAAALPPFEDDFTLSAEAKWFPPMSVKDIQALEEVSGCEVRVAAYNDGPEWVAVFVTFYRDGPCDRDWT